MKKTRSNISAVYSDEKGVVYEFPDREPAFRSGRSFVRVKKRDLIKLPYGSYLFSLPGRSPVYYNAAERKFDSVDRISRKEKINAVSSFLSSAYLRTYLPAYVAADGAPVLSLWAYAGVVVMDDEFYVPALRIDDDPRSDPAIHQNDEELAAAMKEITSRFRDNRLVEQLGLCAVEYRCLCARNFFLGRYEAPVPTTPACNARCMGCLSRQDEGTGFAASQERLDFMPDPEEISQVILHHFSRVDRAVASFGQGCEGEPLLRGGDIARAIAMVREKEGRGTINMNTNGSMPGMVGLLIDAGLDSIRISLNSPTEKYYTRYHRPENYTFDDVQRSLDRAINAGIFVSINLFFMPGFTDMESEVESLKRFLYRFPVNMIQTRNLNIDPDYYFDMIGYEASAALGIGALLDLLRRDYPSLSLGYYNPPKEKFRP